jgi:hypothetical protein
VAFYWAEQFRCSLLYQLGKCGLEIGHMYPFLPPPHTHTHAHTYTRTHTYTHTFSQIYTNMLLSSSLQFTITPTPSVLHCREKILTAKWWCMILHTYCQSFVGNPFKNRRLSQAIWKYVNKGFLSQNWEEIKNKLPPIKSKQRTYVMFTKTVKMDFYVSWIYLFLPSDLQNITLSIHSSCWNLPL